MCVSVYGVRACVHVCVRACVLQSVCEYIALLIFQICKDFIDGNVQNVKWHNEHKVPYAYKGDMWVGYDNEYSLQLKVSFKLVQIITITIRLYDCWKILRFVLIFELLQLCERVIISVSVMYCYLFIFIVCLLQLHVIFIIHSEYNTIAIETFRYQYTFKQLIVR